MNGRSTTHASHAHPLRPVWIGALLSSAFFGLGSVRAWQDGRDFRSLSNDEMRIAELRGHIIHLDEVLTMSARMAAATGDPRWEKRYRLHEPELDAAIKETLQLAPTRFGEAASAAGTDAANATLIAMENDAFAAVRNGNGPAASAILFGAEYERQKAIYAAGMAAESAALDARLDGQERAHHRRTIASTLVGVLLVMAMAIAWALIVSRLRTYFEARQEAERALTDLTEKLELRVVERTQALEKLHETLIQNEKLSSLGLLAAGVAHEINNPMSFVTSNVTHLLKALEREPALSPALLEFRDEVLPDTIDGIKRVNAIVLDLRRFSRGNPEGMVPFDLNAEVRTALRISAGQLKGKCTVESSLGTFPMILGRSQQLTQVVVNLLVNAAQAGALSIRVSTRETTEGVELAIADDGGGMPREVRQRLFQPFFTTKPLGEGTGLGLSVVHGIVKTHGGRIDVASEPGVGTTFTICLPRLPTPDLGASATS